MIIEKILSLDFLPLIRNSKIGFNFAHFRNQRDRAHNQKNKFMIEKVEEFENDENFAQLLNILNQFSMWFHQNINKLNRQSKYYRKRLFELEDKVGSFSRAEKGILGERFLESSIGFIVEDFAEVIELISRAKSETVIENLNLFLEDIKL